MNRVVILGSLVMLVGCSSVSNVSYPLADGTFRNQRTVSDPHAFSPTTQRSWMEICAAKDGQVGAKDLEPDYTKCGESADLQYAVNAGYLDGFAGAAVQAGAIAYAGHAIGRGLGNSGDTVTQEGGGASQSQRQGQQQGQSQAQSSRQYQYNKRH